VSERQRKDVSSNSVLARNGNGSYGTEERQRHNGTAKWQQQNGKTERWKLGINNAQAAQQKIINGNSNRNG